MATGEQKSNAEEEPVTGTAQMEAESDIQAQRDEIQKLLQKNLVKGDTW